MSKFDAVLHWSARALPVGWQGQVVDALADVVAGDDIVVTQYDDAIEVAAFHKTINLGSKRSSGSITLGDGDWMAGLILLRLAKFLPISLVDDQSNLVDRRSLKSLLIGKGHLFMAQASSSDEFDDFATTVGLIPKLDAASNEAVTHFFRKGTTMYERYVVIALVCLIGLIIVFEVFLSIKRAMQSKPVAPLILKEAKEICFRKLWIDIEPAPFKVIVFAEGKYEGRLVLHGPHGGVVTRLLLLWKGDKHRCIKLDALREVGIESIEQVYSTSFAEAKKIAQAVFGKKHHAKTKPATEQAVPQRKTEAPPEPVVVAEHKSATAVVANPAVKAVAAETPIAQQTEAPKTRVVPLHKGFIEQFVGTIVSSGVHQHPTGKYDVFTLTLNTANGPENISGVDVKRAMAVANVEEGDNVRVIHVKDIPLSEGRRKKSFEIVRLPPQQKAAA